MLFDLDSEVFTKALEWLDRQQTVWLCTVTSTWGSAPRKVGALMACNDQGEQIGSLSGGCIEEDLLEKVAKGLIDKEQPSYILYGETPEEAARLKLPCGGTLGVLIEPLAEKDRSWLDEVLASLLKRQRITRSINWPQDTQPNLSQTTGDSNFNCVIENGRPQQLQHSYGPPYHLFLIGISEVSRALASFARLMDYRITVCDPRPELIARWDLEGTQTIKAMPDDALLEHANDAFTAVLALTHDPRIDDMGLLEAFNTDAFYIGAMGSAATSKKRLQRLQELGISAEQLQRLHAPIGLDIGSKTPAEIAISILAELTQVRAQQQIAAPGCCAE